MLKNVFRLFAGGRAHPEIVFTCRGINFEQVINAIQLPADILRPLCALPGATLMCPLWRLAREFTFVSADERPAPVER
ncbi:hypothetical protein [Enterobacter sp. PTB]|uniref:hypothetical protein n=1 Tax=Enterobacter sp. PTB TaxID=3143437 RepID=UPI003DA83B71